VKILAGKVEKQLAGLRETNKAHAMPAALDSSTGAE
jgi:hypothetical protein